MDYGLLEAYYKDKHEINTKSELSGTRNQKLAFFHWYLILGQKHVVTMQNH